ncbi:hypothetical protein B0H15DRAFT_382452 [Mycena belliarum]|uniref:Uncharacterized protein n=1 Tax=Mycena belliarum TaxID=1033014 RepID=A0AAD6TZS7_9AGAR|nr:hypothetical protein B0H15DRAFT_382452 [Mycena belliae]
MISQPSELVPRLVPRLGLGLGLGLLPSFGPADTDTTGKSSASSNCSAACPKRRTSPVRIHITHRRLFDCRRALAGQCGGRSCCPGPAWPAWPVVQHILGRRPDAVVGAEAERAVRLAPASLPVPSPSPSTSKGAATHGHYDRRRTEHHDHDHDHEPHCRRHQWHALRPHPRHRPRRPRFRPSCPRARTRPPRARAPFPSSLQVRFLPLPSPSFHLRPYALRFIFVRPANPADARFFRRVAHYSAGTGRGTRRPASSLCGSRTLRSSLMH